VWTRKYVGIHSMKKDGCNPTGFPVKPPDQIERKKDTYVEVTHIAGGGRYWERNGVCPVSSVTPKKAIGKRSRGERPQASSTQSW